MTTLLLTLSADLDRLQSCDDLLRTGAFALAFAGSVGISTAQQRPPPGDAQQQSQQEKAQQTPSGKMGKEEPSSHPP